MIRRKVITCLPPRDLCCVWKSVFRDYTDHFNNWEESVYLPRECILPNDLLNLHCVESCGIKS